MLKNRCIYGIFLIVGGYHAIMYDQYITLLIWWLIVIVPLLTSLVLLVWKKHVHMQVGASAKVVKMGEHFFVEATIKNGSIFPVSIGKFAIKYKHCLDNDYEKKEMLCRADSMGQQKIKMNFHAIHCGLLKFSWEQVKIYDYFGIFSVKIPITDAVEVLVIPEFEALEYKDVLKEDEQEAQFNPRNEKGEDVSEVIGIREYKQGDHPKRIHWKLSSKKKQIMIKEYGEESDDERIIEFSMLCPRGECTYDWYDEKLEELVNTSWTLFMNHLVHKVRWYNPTGEYTELSEIKKIEDIGFMVEQVIRAGVGETEERELENDGEKDICVKN